MTHYTRNIETTQDGVSVVVELSEKNIGDFTLKALAAWYGVKSFKTKAAAHEACLARLAEIDAMDDGDGSEPMIPDAKKDSEIESDDDYERDEDGNIIVTVTPDTSEATPDNIVSASVRAKMAAGTARTWNDPAVRAKRMIRNSVVCDGVEYGSVRKAFEALGLPDSKHIKFRLGLKAAGHAVFEYEGRQFHFVIASSSSEE